MISDTDWAYLAGLIEGEGTIGLYPYSNARPDSLKLSPRVVISMNTKQPVKWIYETFGCIYSGPKKVRTPRGLEIRYRWATYQVEGCLLVLEGVLPYMKLKNIKAKEVIKYCEWRLQHGGLCSK